MSCNNTQDEKKEEKMRTSQKQATCVKCNPKKRVSCVKLQYAGKGIGYYPAQKAGKPSKVHVQNVIYSSE